jgi:molybdopterin converting factor small subunit
MSVKINLHRTHRPLAGDAETVEVQGGTVGECLASLVAAHPAMGEALFESTGKLRNTIEIYLNLSSAYPGELTRPTADGDEIHITVLLAGG